MKITFTRHSSDRIVERGTSRSEVVITVKTGTAKPGSYDITKFESVFGYNKDWNGTTYKYKRVVVTAQLLSKIKKHWKIITVIVKFFN